MGARVHFSQRVRRRLGTALLLLGVLAAFWTIRHSTEIDNRVPQPPIQRPIPAGGSHVAISPTTAPSEAGHRLVTPNDRVAATGERILSSRYCIEGTVTEHDGQVIPGVSVEALGSEGHATESRPDGSFRLESTEPIERIHVARPQFVSRFVDGLAAESDRCRVLRIVLARSVSLRGTVQDIRDAPLDGVEVGLSDGDIANGLGARTLTDSSGHFTLSGFPAGTYFIAARRPDLVPSVVGPIELTIERETTDLTIVLDGGWELEGHVATVGGSDVPGAAISVTTDSGNKKQVKTDQHGRFSVTGLDDRSLSLAVSAEGFEDYAARVDARSPVEITLIESGIARGRVIDALTRLPIADFTVGARRFRDARGTFALPSRGGSSPMRIVVSAEGYASYDAGAYRIPSGEVLDLGDVPLEAGASITGVALDISGRPLSGLPIHRARADVEETEAAHSEIRTAYTNSDGTFTFDHVPPGSWMIWANFGEDSWATQVIELDQRSTILPLTLMATPPDDGSD